MNISEHEIFAARSIGKRNGCCEECRLGRLKFGIRDEYARLCVTRKDRIEKGLMDWHESVIRKCADKAYHKAESLFMFAIINVVRLK